MNIQRSRNADGNKVTLGDAGEVSRSLEAALGDELRQVLLHNIADVVLAGVDLVDLRLLNVKANGPEARLGFLDR